MYYIVAFALIFGMAQDPSIPGPLKVVGAIGLIGLARFMNWATSAAFKLGQESVDKALGEDEAPPEGKA